MLKDFGIVRAVTLKVLELSALPEETYYALSILDIAGQIEPDQETRRYLLPLQNSDGGFRRSPYLGISSLENTFYAAMGLKLLDKSI